MAFVKITKPVPPAPPAVELKINGTIILITAAGSARLSEIAPALAGASAANLYYDADTSAVAVVPAPHGDKDAVTVRNLKGGKKSIQGKLLFDVAGIAAGASAESSVLAGYENGITFNFARGRGRGKSTDVTPIPKRQVKLDADGNPVPQKKRGRRSKAEIAAAAAAASN